MQAIVIHDGTCAELVVGKPRHFAPKPANVDFVTAAGLPLTGLTTVQSLRLAGVREGDTVLVHAAAGGVGSFAVQWAQVLGATVIGTASERNHDYLRELGATPATYGDGLVERVGQAAPGRRDRLSRLHRRRGGLRRVGRARQGRQPHRVERGPQAVSDVGGRYSFVRPQAADLAELSRQVEAGAIGIEIQQVFPLSDAAKAHEVSQGGHVRGKLVLEV